MTKYSKVGNVELALNDHGMTQRYHSWGEFTIPCRFNIKNVITGCVHEVERICIAGPTGKSKGHGGYITRCGTHLSFDNYIFANHPIHPITCKSCINKMLNK